MTEKVMGLFILDGKGNFGQGFIVSLKNYSGDLPSLDAMEDGGSGELPPAPDLPGLYEAWKIAYRNYLDIRAYNPNDDNNEPPALQLKSRTVKTNVAGEYEKWKTQKEQAYHACTEAEKALLKRFHEWLNSANFGEVKDTLKAYLFQSKEQANRILIESNDKDFQKMPWQKWDLLTPFSLSEVGLSSPNFKKRYVPIKPKERARVLVILGKDANIKKKIQQLATANIEIKFVTTLAELDEPLWNEVWDIIVFNGHSGTSEKGTEGKFQLSQDQWLSISDIRNHLNKAIDQGLKLVIFNSCDGLGLAHQLGEGQQLYLPQIMVMRDLLPMPLAPIFLQYFFEEFIKGISLYSALRATRDRLKIKEKEFPCASWLPVICQNPAENPVSWWDLVIPPCPYRGLSAFQEEDADLFFGREKVIDQLIEVVKHKKLVAVIGASGSGKSSVVLAGVIPCLRQQENWLIASLRPGDTPFENLAKSLSLPEELARQLREGISRLSDVLKKINQSRTVLLVVDQFEEIYSYPNQAFLECLLEGIENLSGLRLVITLRADFLGQAIEYTPFREQLQRWKPEFIGAMDRIQLQAVIEEPARKRGVDLEGGLTEHILRDVDKQPGYLPLLEFALTEMWDKQKNSLLTRQIYDEIGGVENALRKHAERVYDQLKKEDQERAKRIFIQLVSPGEGTEYIRRIATRAEVGEENWDFVTGLATTRLVVTNRNETTEIETVEIVHEALIKAWPDLQKWIEEDDTFLRWKKRLQVALREWEKNQNQEGYLLQGAPLGEAEGYLWQRLGDVSPAEREFIQLGLGLRDRNRRRTILSLTSGLLAVSIFAVGAFWQWQRAERQALINKVDSLSNLALNQFQSGEGGINALMIAMEAGEKLKQLVKQNEALENYPTTTAVDALETIVKNIKEKNKFYTESGITRTIFTPDGSQIVGLNSLDGKIILGDLTGKKITEWQDPEEKEVFSLAMSPNGKYLASINEDKKLFIWNLSGKQIAIGKPGLIGFGEPEVKFTPDGNYIAVSSSENDTVIFFDLSGHKVKELKTNSVVRTFEFTPNGQEIVTGNSRGFLQFWNLQTLEKIRGFQVNKNLVLEIKFSPDGKQVLIRGADITSEKEWKQIVRLWDLSGQKIADLGIFSILGQATYGAVSFSPNGKQIAIVIPGDGRIILYDYDAKTGMLVQQIKVNALSGHLTYSPDGKTIVVSNIKQGINLLNINNIEQNFIELPTKYEYQAGDLKFQIPINLNYSPDGKKILISSPGRFLDIWDWQKKQYIQQLVIKESIVKSKFYPPDSPGLPVPNFANVTPDGKYIISVNAQSVEKFDLAGNSISKVIADVPETEIVLLKGDENYSSSFDGNIILTKGRNLNNSHDSPVRFWDLSLKQVKKLKNDHIPEMTDSVVISPNGKYIFTTKSDLGKLWDTNGNLIAGSIDIKTQPSKGNPSLFSLGILLVPEKEDGNFYDVFNGKSHQYYSGWEIWDVFPNSTAHQAGLKPGHIILAIDDNKVSDINLNKFYEIMMKKDQGSPVKLTVKINREILTDKIEEKFIQREKITYGDQFKDQFIWGNIGKFSPDSKYLASFYKPGINSKNTLQLRNLMNKKFITIDHQVPIIQANFSPNSQLLATTGVDYSVKLWDMSGKLINQIKLEQPANGLAFSPNNKMFAVLGYPNQLSIWGIDGKLIAKYTVPEEGQGQIVFSPDGKYVATAGRKVFIWRLGKDLDDLLNSGCDWLKEYFVTHPEEKQKLKVCQDHPKSK